MSYYAYYGRLLWPFDNSFVTFIFAWEVVLALVLWAFEHQNVYTADFVNEKELLR